MRRSLRRAAATLSLMMLSALALADPSGRVGRVSAIEGQVSFRSSSQAGAEAANLNWPVTSSNLISTSRNGRAEFRVGSSVVQINGDSELEVIVLDDDAFRLRLNYGSLYLTIKNPEVAQDLSVATPHGSLRLSQPARLRLDTEVMPDLTAVAVLSGAAQFENAGATLKIGAGKRMEINDSSTRLVAARRDAFDDWSAARERFSAADGRAESARYVSSEITGHEELDRYGDWRVVDEFGPVWTPRNVAADWAPYRDGRWTWIEPWGWTWVDDAPWGYAPSHYGRWVWLDLRWYWVPGRMAARPVWAPAVVGWTGGAHWSLSAGGRAGPGVGWFPLAPREAYVPAYRVSSAYVERINHAYGASMQSSPQYRNARVALTVVPQAQFAAPGSVSVGGTKQAAHGYDQRPPSDAQFNGRGNPPPGSWSRGQERPAPVPAPAPVLQGQSQNPVAAPVQVQGTPQALPPTRTVQVTPVMQPAPPMQVQPQSLPPARVQPVSMPVQQVLPPPAARENHDHGRSQPPPQVIQPQQQQQAIPQQQPAPQGNPRERERERAAARQERRQPGEHEPGSTGR